MGKRHILNNRDKEVLDLTKEALTVAIATLKATGLRDANIQIELNQHIKKELAKETV